MYHFIYETKNLINGKLYRGKHSTENMDDGYLGSGIAIMRALDKYGRENFKRTILQMCKDVHIAYFHETLYVNPDWVNRDDTYNLVPGGLGGYGAKHSEETKKRLSEAQTGKKASEETKRKMSVSHMGNVPSKETREKLSKSLTGRALSEKHKAAVSKTLTGYKHTEEAKKNMGDSHRGKKHSADAKAKMSAAQSGEKHHMYGKSISKEHKEKIGAAHRGKKHRIVTCPHCTKSGGISIMKRFHFDNCLNNLGGSKERKAMKPYGPQNIIACPHCRKIGGANAMKRYHFDNCKNK